MEKYDFKILPAEDPADKLLDFLKKSHPNKFRRMELMKFVNISSAEASHALKRLIDRHYVIAEVNDHNRVVYGYNIHWRKTL